MPAPPGLLLAVIASAIAPDGPVRVWGEGERSEKVLSDQAIEDGEA